MARKFPRELLDYIGAHDFDDLPDGAWFATLEAAAIEWNEQNGTDYCENDAAHAYLEAFYEA